MTDRLTGADPDRLDARARLTDREREALRIDQQVRSILALIERTKTDEKD